MSMCWIRAPSPEPSAPRFRSCQRAVKISRTGDSPARAARAPPVARSRRGIYRFWRDRGYALGALIAGAVADTRGYGGAIAVVAGLTGASGLWVLVDMPGDRRPTGPVAARRRLA